MASVRFENIVKSFGDVSVIKGIDLDIQDGEFVVFVGPSGCGKTTLLRLLAGLEETTQGNVYIGDTLVNDVAPKNRDIAMVFQNYALYPHLTVAENMGFGLKLRGIRKSDRQQAVAKAAAVLGIEGLLDRRPRQLSGGQRQRVAMGRAMVRQPAVFLMDEPLSNLDAKLRNQMRVEIKKLQRRLATTTIYVTHDQVEAMTLADRIAVINQGELLQFGSPAELYNAPANKFVAGFLGSPAINFIAAERIGERELVLPDGQRLTVPPEFVGPLSSHRNFELGIRPEQIRVAPHERKRDDATVAWSATVTLTEPLGGEALLYASLGNQDITVKIPQEQAIQEGQTAEFSFELSRAHLFLGGDVGPCLRPALAS